MPIKSYIAYPLPNQKQTLSTALNSISSCEVTESENEDLIILVTDTANNTEEEELEQKLSELPSLLSLAMVSGVSDDE